MTGNQSVFVKKLVSSVMCSSVGVFVMSHIAASPVCHSPRCTDMCRYKLGYHTFHIVKGYP